MKALYNFKLTTPESRNKNRLIKVHRLKKESRVLSDRRKKIMSNAKYYQDSTLRVLYEVNILTMNKLSERIGKTGAKVQRLRTLIQQEKAKMVQSKLHVREQLKNMLRLSGIVEAELDSEVEKWVKGCYKGVQP